MINNKDKIECCGCSACYHKCPVNAITIKADEEGFEYPSVDPCKCIKCGLCIKVCPFCSVDNVQSKPKHIFAVKNCDNAVRIESSSGGIFMEMCNYAVKKKGIVFGAAFDSDYAVIHKAANSIDECKFFQGAKYVQSRVGDTFSNIKDLLNSGKYVLFSGTPCQVAGLVRYLDMTDTSNLITCDIVCHGVPSPLVWKRYLEFVSKRKNIKRIAFRDKTNGWHHSELQIEGDNIKISQNHGENPYSLLYFNHYSLRPSCSKCPFANMYRVGDISIGDYWNIEKSHPEIDDDKGVSLVMVNTEKGEKLFQSIKECLLVVPSNEQECFQPNLREPSKLNDDRAEFWKCFRNKGLEHTIKLFTFYGDNELRIKVERKFIKCKSKIKRIWRRIND